MQRAIVIVVLSVLALVAAPMLAQDSVPHVVSFDAFSFALDPAFALNVNISQYPGDPVEFGPGFADAPHTQIALYDDLGLPESVFQSKALIRVYDIDRLAPYPFLYKHADALQSLLQERPDLALFEIVSGSGMADVAPYIPTLPHGQILRARMHYVETDAVAGIAYLTHSNAAPEPFQSHSFTYTFQGVSADGRYYLSVSFPVTTGLFPAEPSPIEPDEFFEAWPSYLVETIAALNAEPAAAFAPSLEALDAFVATFQFDADSAA